MDIQSLNKIIEAHTLDAVDMAKDFGIELNYSNESINRVEQILNTLYEDAKKGGISDQQYSNMAKRFGSYIGTTLIRNIHKGTWEIEPSNNALAIKIEEEHIFFPAKVFRRLKNGPEDSVSDLYFSVLHKYNN